MKDPADASGETYSLSALCQLSGVTPRTVRYYIEQGLLPSPGMGPGTRYGRGHLDRLLLIRRLQQEHLPLAEIRRRLEPMDDEAVARALEDAGAHLDHLAPPAPERPPVSGGAVSEYVAAVLGREQGLSRRGEARSLRRPRAPVELRRERWDRYRFGEDVEIHVRRPQSRELNRRVERLLRLARRILGEERH